MIAPEEIRRQVRQFVAIWLLIHPEDESLPSDVVRRAAARRVIALERLGEPPLFPVPIENRRSPFVR